MVALVSGVGAGSAIVAAFLLPVTTVVTLFVDGSPRGDVSQMRGMRVSDVLDITFLSASEAAFRFGTLAGSGGAVAIRTGR